MNHHDYLDANLKVMSLHEIRRDGSCGCENPDCEAVGKHPRVANWQFTPHWTDEQIEFMEMVGQFSTGFGVLCDGLLIIDIDPRNGGSDSYKKLVADTGIDFKKEAGFVVATGGGGWHIYYHNPSSAQLKKNLREYPGIDFKTNGFVVGAGSMHKSGGVYESESGHPCELTPAPSKLIAMLEKPEFEVGSCEASESEIADMLNFIDPDCDYEQWVQVGMAVHHSTDGTGFDLWNAWSAKGSKYNAAEMDVKWHSFGKCSNPVTAGTLHKLAEDGGYSQPVTFKTDLVATEEDYASVDGEPVNVRAIDTMTAPGLLGDIIRFINDNCRYPRERLAVGAAINALGNIAGLRWRDADYGVTSNVFVFCVAGSATGKEAVQDAQKVLQSAVGLAPATYGKIKSEQEITRNLIEHQFSSYIIDELGIFLQKLENASTRGSASYLEGVIGDLMSIYSKADGRLLLSGDAYKETMKKLAEEKNFWQDKLDANEMVETAERRLRSAAERESQLKTGGLLNPFMSMIGFTTPVTFNTLVTYNAATNGFIGRSMIFEEKDNSPRSKRGFKKRPVDQQLQMKLNSVAYCGESSVNDDHRIEHYGEKCFVTTAPEASALLDKVLTYLELYADHHEETTGLEAIVNRAFEQILKVSMICAIGDGGRRTVEHVQWAYAIVKQDVDNKINLAGGNIAQQSKQKTDEVLSKVRHALDKSQAQTLGAIANRHRNITKEQIQQCLDYLERLGEARKEEVRPERGRPSVKWYAR